MESKIIADLKESYGVTFNGITPVTGGLKCCGGYGQNFLENVTKPQSGLKMKCFG